MGKKVVIIGTGPSGTLLAKSILTILQQLLNTLLFAVSQMLMPWWNSATIFFPHLRYYSLSFCCGKE
ncbi:hypothetical protein [Fischerella sp. PCC 9605]|uniref:hypothetical protein n=1 Tax=Fischerella sp. PCC 9605 TaxID=1173024 RepID=UPI0004AF8737|nr:hypothetical protein [Fischerella sp. PCC 9605]